MVKLTPLVGLISVTCANVVRNEIPLIDTTAIKHLRSIESKQFLLKHFNDRKHKAFFFNPILMINLIELSKVIIKITNFYSKIDYYDVYFSNL